MTRQVRARRGRVAFLMEVCFGMAIFDVIPLTRREKDAIVRRELARRLKIGAAQRGRPKSSEHNRKVSEGMRRSWARRKAALASDQHAIETT